MYEDRIDVVTPLLNIYMIGCNKKLMTVGPLLWKDYAYFRVLMRDSKKASVDVKFTSDFENFLKFLKNDIPSVGDTTDFVLQVKEYCVQLGIETNSFSHGRLHKLLTDVAIKHYNTYKVNCMLDIFYKDVLDDLQSMKAEKERYIDLFCNLSTEIDPRCVNFS